MAFRVLLTLNAARDLEEIYDYIAEHNSLAAASHVGILVSATFNGFMVVIFTAEIVVCPLTQLGGFAVDLS